MNINQRAVRTLELRERAKCGQWIPRRIKVALIVVLAGLALVIHGVYRQPDPMTIGLASFLSGVVFMLVCGLFVFRRAYQAAWPFTEMVTDWNKVRELAGAPFVSPPDA